MADTKPSDFSTTAASNGTVGGVNVAEGMQAAQINNALRAVLAVIANPDFGTLPFKVDTIDESTADAGVTIEGVLIKDGGLPDITSAQMPSLVLSLTGDYKPTSRATADAGWLMANGDTLGSAASGADQASDANEALFLHLWNSFDDAQLPVTGSRGASAAADWAANKIIALPNLNNRMPVGAGDTYANGETGGTATVTLTKAQIPNYTWNPSGMSEFNVGALGTGSNDIVRPNDSGAAFTISSGGSGQAHENMPPFFGVYWQIKL